jgi:hypothetical protein
METSNTCISVMTVPLSSCTPEVIADATAA